MFEGVEMNAKMGERVVKHEGEKYTRMAQRRRLCLFVSRFDSLFVSFVSPVYLFQFLIYEP